MKYLISVVITFLVIVGAFFICNMEDSDDEIYEFHNVWVREMKDDKLSCVVEDRDVDSKGSKKINTERISYSTKNYKLADKIDVSYKDVLADIVVKEDKVIKVILKPVTVKGRLIAIDLDGKSIEIEKYGNVELTNDFKIYEVKSVKDDGVIKNSIIKEGDNKIKNVNEVKDNNKDNEESKQISYVSYDLNKLNIDTINMEYVVEKDKICGIILNNNNNIDKYESVITDENNEKKYIKVLLKNSNFGGIYHEYISLKSDGDLEILYVNDARQVSVAKSREIKIDKLEENELKKKNYISKKIKANSTVKITSNSKYFDSYSRIIITNKNGVTIPSIKRSTNGLKYKGYLEIIKDKQGLVIVNTLDIEEYLYSVVPSEMPESYPIEALKAQAICARTYAMNKIINSGYKKYGAHLDDSISYQVYNNMRYGKNSKRAVDETKGKIISYKGKPASVYYYSTSCGYSSTVKDVFGGKNVAYLPSKKQVLSTDGDYFEQNCEWFKWKTSINGDKLSRSINDNIYRMNKSGGISNVKVYNKKTRKYVKGVVSNIGKLKSIQVKERKSGGIVTKLIIKGTKKNICIENQYTIRQILAVDNQIFVNNNGNKVKVMTTLPSGFFKIKKKGGSYIITGGGYGHGVGMSQCGASKLAKMGYSYKEILDFYFVGAKIQ